jgi:hypothetical protein
MARIHHSIIKSVANNGSAIIELEDGTFALTNEDNGLRAVSDDARALCKLAKAWAEGEDMDDYTVEVDEVEDDEDKRTGSVVHPGYKLAYKAAGHPDNCGDWLAYTWRMLTRNGDDSLNWDAVVELVELNGINDWAKYKADDAGWRGRAAMNCCNRLRNIIRKSEDGVMMTTSGPLAAPAEFLAK